MKEQAIRSLKPPPMRQRSVRFDDVTESFLARHILPREQAFFIRSAVEEKIRSIAETTGRSRKRSNGKGSK